MEIAVILFCVSQSIYLIYAFYRDHKALKYHKMSAIYTEYCLNERKKLNGDIDYGN